MSITSSEKNDLCKAQVRPVIGYTCSYFPGELVRALGFDILPFFDISSEATSSRGVLPVTMCTYTSYCMDLIDSVSVAGMVLTNCCNSMQRLHDYIRIKKPGLFCYMLDLPRDFGPADVGFWGEGIKKLAKALCERFSKRVMDISIVELGFDNALEVVEDKTIYILGSALSPKTRLVIAEHLKPYKVKTNLCCDRESRVFKLFPTEQGEDGDLASGVRLAFRPCARMDCFSSWFEQWLTEHCSHLAGVIYMPSQHCDSFLFRYPSIQKVCRKNGLRTIYLEESYNLSGLNRMLTRLEAFVESLTFSKTAFSVPVAPNHTAASRTFRQRMRLVEGIVPVLPLEAIKKVVSNQVEVFSKEIWDNPHRTVWTNMAMTVEAFYAADLIPVNMELVAGWLASLGLSREYISRSEGLGLSSNACSYHKAVMGLLDEGGLPPPRGAVISSHVCDGGPGMAYYFSERYQTDVLILNVPYLNEASSFEYLLEQYKNLLKWVERYSGVRVTREMLAASLELSSQARGYWTKAINLRLGRPLFPGHLALRNLFGATFLFGSKLGVDVARSYYEQLQALSEEQRDESPNKKSRLLWIHFAPLYRNKIMEYLEKELDCWIVADIVSHIYWPEFDLDRPLESLVRKTLSHFYLGNVQARRELYHRLVKDYRIDGVVHFMHAGCRAIPGSAWLVRDIANELDLPYLELTGDCIDPRGYSDEQFRLRLDAFRETLWRRMIVPGN